MEQFVHHYSLGKCIDGLRHLFPSPETTLEGEPPSPLHYADSLLFGTPMESYLLNLALQQKAEGPFLEALQSDARILYILSLPQEEQEAYRDIPLYRFTNEWEWSYLFEEEVTGVPKLSLQAFEGHQKIKGLGPYTTISYPFFDELPPIPKEGTPVILLEAWEIDWESYLAPLKGREALLVLLDVHPLQFPAVREFPILLAGHPVPKIENPQHISLSPHVDQFDLHDLRRLQWEIRNKRLGKRSHLAHRLNCSLKAWHSEDKGGVPELQLPPRTVSPQPAKSGRVAHVMSIYREGGHAPSRILRTILEHGKAFQHDVFLSEALAFRLDEYPINFDVAHPSDSLEQEVWRAPREGSYQSIAEELCKKLESYDAALFHGPDPINFLAGRMCKPLSLFFDHGAIPDREGFDAICSIPFIPKPWSGEPKTLPPKAMTTISFHLDNRLSDEMCAAITEILRRCPDALYMPIGPIDEERFRKLWGDRVIFLGAQEEPAAYLPNMRLYLNEFPFGSGLSLLDALHAGCPIVTLHDPSGPPQAQFGGNYMGRWANSVDEYIETACRLLNDDTFHQEWSEAARTAHAKRGTPADYVHRIESFIDGILTKAGA